MVTNRQRRAAGRTVRKAQQAAASKKTIAHLPAKTRTALGKQHAAVARHKRPRSASPKTRAELYEIARQRDLPGRSRIGRGELARKLGETSG
jgi:transposase